MAEKHDQLSTNTEETQVDLNEHLLSIDEIQAKYAVKVDLKKPSQSPGLSALDAAKRLKENGPNCLTPPKKLHPFLQYLLYLLHLFNVMLWVSGIVALIIFAVDSTNNFPNVYIGSILLFVAFMNAFVDFYQTQKSQAILESFLNLIPSKCYVIRDGQTTQISAVELVVGDIVYIRSGDKIPADLVIFASTEIKVDNSSLTGEVEAQGRGVTNTQNNPLEATNLIFNGTLAVNGEAYGVVIRTGDHTVIGQIAFMTSSEERRPSPMSAEIENYVTLIASIASVIALAFFLISYFGRNRTLAFSFNFAIGTFTSFVPQGLPTTVSVLLSLAAKRMASRNVLVKDLQSVETLGAITLLATDKTGTLTKNQMTVT
ncbi:E1-E2 ATPase-domain-containing protein, partial [Globomyces pollinis-pini]